MENRNLSICIPTYDRSAKLNDSLSKLIPIIRKFNIPIIISDNCSNDNTRDIVETKRIIYKYIYYYRNNSNLGPDKNFEIALKYSKTKYSWLFGDDDYIVDNNIELFMTFLDKNMFDLIVVNHIECGYTKHDVIYLDNQRLLEDLAYHMSFMSSLIFNTHLIKLINFKKYYNTNFIHLGILFDHFSKNNCNVFFYENLYVKPLPGRIFNWKESVFKTMLVGFSNIIINLPSHYSSKSKLIAIKKIQNSYVKLGSLIHLKFEKEIDLRFIMKYFKYLYNAFGIKKTLFALILVIIPDNLLRFIHKTIRKVKEKNNKLNKII